MITEFEHKMISGPRFAKGPRVSTEPKVVPGVQEPGATPGGSTNTKNEKDKRTKWQTERQR